jgi:hypothetical protein
MQVFQCENCHSVFIVNETDERIINGNYGVPKKIDCSVCSADMYLMELKEENEE